MKHISSTQRLTISAMSTALTVLALFAYGTLPTGRYACLFISSLFVYIVAFEKAYVWAAVSFLASCALALLMAPDKLALAPFIALLGHFGIMKAIVDERIKDDILRFAVIFLYCNIFTAAGVALAIYAFDVDVPALLPDFALWLIILIAEAGFILFTLLYSFCQRIYVQRFRRFVIGSGR